MKIKLLCNLGTNDYPDTPLQEGEHDVPDNLANKLIARKLAVAIEQPKPPEVKAVPAEPTIASSRYEVGESGYKQSPIAKAAEPKQVNRPRKETKDDRNL